MKKFNYSEKKDLLNIIILIKIFMVINLKKIISKLRKIKRKYIINYKIISKI